MSHHIVTVCVVCVLCAAHVPCSAHTSLSATMHSSDSSTNVKDLSNSDTQSFLALIRSKNTYPYSDNYHTSHTNNLISNKHDAAIHSTRHVNRNSGNNVPVIAAKSTASRDTYVKKKITGNFKGGGNVRDTQSSVATEDMPINLENLALIERLAQTELLASQKSAQSSEVSQSINKPRMRRAVNENIAVNERYFMKKIFEAYGDGTSITMEGFEKLVRKLGLHKLLADPSDLETSSTDKSIYKIRSDNKH